MSETRDGGRVRCVRTLGWREPLEVAAGLAQRDGALCLLSDPALPGSRSFVAADPAWTVTLDEAEGGPFAGLTARDLAAGVIGLASYDAGARVATGPRDVVWPDLMMARYSAMLVFDHDAGQVRVIGWGQEAAAANAACDLGETWMTAATSPGAPPPPATALIPDAGDSAYLCAVTEVVTRIRAGDLFQANIARGWTAVLGPQANPFDVFVRLAQGGAAPYGAFWRLGERALVSNSPELFLTLDTASRRVETRPIKGTRPRDPDPVQDAANAADLLASAKDRAENLMIVDLMRNDLSRVCEAGSIRVENLFAPETLPTVHHLVSTVSGRLEPEHGIADLLQATFPPGSITGAPKHQAMKVIAGHEPPRGAWCGSLFLVDEDANLTASVLIRTASFEREDGRWRVRTQAGAGIVADSDPVQELAETEVKIAALRRALTG